MLGSLQELAAMKNGSAPEDFSNLVRHTWPLKYKFMRTMYAFGPLPRRHHFFDQGYVRVAFINL